MFPIEYNGLKTVKVNRAIGSIAYLYILASLSKYTFLKKDHRVHSVVFYE
jgi:hypothetical protein